MIPYFFVYKMELFSFPNNSKNLEPSYKTDLDIWDCLGRVKLVLQQICVRLIPLFVLILELGKPAFYSRINTDCIVVQCKSYITSVLTACIGRHNPISSTVSCRKRVLKACWVDDEICGRRSITCCVAVCTSLFRASRCSVQYS